MIKHRCPLLPKPDFVLCHRFKGKERFKGHYGLKPFHYGKIQTKAWLRSIKHTRKRYERQNRKALCTLLHMTLAMIPKQQSPNNLPSPVLFQIFDVWRGYRYAEVVLLRHTSIPHEKGVLVAIFCEIMGIDVETCKRIFGPRNAKSNKLPSLAKYIEGPQHPSQIQGKRCSSFLFRTQADLIDRC
jgi:hypothetical protein